MRRPPVPLDEMGDEERRQWDLACRPPAPFDEMSEEDLLKWALEMSPVGGGS